MDAYDAIGEADDTTDWVLKPEEHAARLPPEAAPLARILATRQVQRLIRDHRQHDADAIHHQARYKRASQRQVAATTVAVLSGGLFLLIATGTENALETVGGLAAITLQAVAIFASAILVYLLRDNDAYEDWMLGRSAAENARVDLFETVCGRRTAPPAEPSAEPSPEDPASGPELPLIALQFEYFRRYQLDVQIRYYLGRARQHRHSALRFRLSGFVLIVITGLIAAAQRFEIFQTGWFPSTLEMTTYLAFAWLVLPLIYQAQDILKLTNGDRRNALRYRITGQNLEVLARNVEDLRHEIAERGEDARPLLNAFIERIHEQISVENREWQRLHPRSITALLEVD